MAETRPGSDIKLPSLGLPYNSRIPEGQLTVYSMRTTEEKMFAGLGSRLDVEKCIDYMIKRCSNLKDHDVEPSELLIGDRSFVMMRIRAASYGKIIRYSARCTECQKAYPYDIDLVDGLEVKYADPKSWENVFQVTLPRTGDVVSLRLLNGEDQIKIIQYHDRQLKNMKNAAAVMGDPSFIYRLALHIVKVESDDKKRSIAESSVTLLQESLKYCEELLAMDAAAIREECNKRSPGLELNTTLECHNPDCRSEFDTGITLTADFFRPASIS